MDTPPTRPTTVPTDASEDPSTVLAELCEIRAAAERVAAWQHAMRAELHTMRAAIERGGR